MHRVLSSRLPGTLEVGIGKGVAKFRIATLFLIPRPNEIVIYESTRYNGRLFERKRTKGRFVTGGAGDDVVVSLDMTDFRRIGGGGRGVRRRREEAAPVHRAEVDRPERAERRPARCRRQDVVERLRERRFNLRFRDGATAVTTNPAPAPSPPLQLGTAAGLTQRLATLLDSAAVSREVAEQHTWNPSDKSFNIVMKADDPTVMRRQPVAQSTDCIRGRVGYTQGVHMWEVRVISILNTPYSQSSAKLPIIQSFGHLIIWLCGTLVLW